MGLKHNWLTYWSIYISYIALNWCRIFKTKIKHKQANFKPIWLYSWLDFSWFQLQSEIEENAKKKPKRGRKPKHPIKIKIRKPPAPPGDEMEKQEEEIKDEEPSGIEPTFYEAVITEMPKKKRVCTNCIMYQFTFYVHELKFCSEF